MLVLSRQLDESIMIGDDIVITLVDIRGDKIRLGIAAPPNVPIHRQEVYEAIQRENMQAAFVDIGLERAAFLERRKGVAPAAQRRRADTQHRRHVAQRLRPFARITLHLLRIAGIRKIPDEEITRTDGFALRYPRPSVIVRLSTRVTQLDIEPAKGLLLGLFFISYLLGVGLRGVRAPRASGSAPGLDQELGGPICGARTGAASPR